MNLPSDLLILVVDNLAAWDAASFACVSRDARDAYRASQAFQRAFHQVRIARDGEVHEPASGVFDVTVSAVTGESFPDAIARCPRGGCVLLLPGEHGSLYTVYVVNNDVHVFGRGRATVNAHVNVRCCNATFTGTTFTQTVILYGPNYSGVLGAGVFVDAVVGTELGARISHCAFHHMVAWCDGANPTIDQCFFNGNVFAVGADTKGRFTRNTVKRVEMHVERGASPLISQNTFFGDSVSMSISVFSPFAGNTATIVDNIITDARIGIAFQGLTEHRPFCRIEGNAIRRCSTGVQVYGMTTAHIANNVLEGNAVGIALAHDSRATIVGNRILGTGLPHGCGIDMQNSEVALINNDFNSNFVHVIIAKKTIATLQDNRFRHGAVNIVRDRNATCTHDRRTSKSSSTSKSSITSKSSSSSNAWLRWHLKAAGAGVLGVGLGILFAFRPRTPHEVPGSLAAVLAGACIAYRFLRN